MKKKFISVATARRIDCQFSVWVGRLRLRWRHCQSTIASRRIETNGKCFNCRSPESLARSRRPAEDINALTAGKADAQAVKDLQGNVAALQTAITENDITKIGELSSQVSELIAQVNGIEGDLDKTQSWPEQQKTELEGKVNSLRADLEKAIADKADQATVDSIKSELDTAVTNHRRRKPFGGSREMD